MRNSTVCRASSRQLQPREHRAREAQAFDRVVLVAPLADVVIQQRQRQQFGRVHLVRRWTEPRAARARRMRERLEVRES